MGFKEFRCRIKASFRAEIKNKLENLVKVTIRFVESVVKVRVSESVVPMS